MRKRAQGCMVGQLAGDALGSQVEFCSEDEISRQYPDGLRLITGGGTWATIAGQATDDSEMALALAHTLIDQGKYDAQAAKAAYLAWISSGPFDCGMTIRGALQGYFDPDSQANGALMRISPLGIFGVGKDRQILARWAQADAELTHINRTCGQINAVYTVGIAHAIETGCDRQDVYAYMFDFAKEQKYSDKMIAVMAAARECRPERYSPKSGWVLIAWQNALWQLLHARSFEDAVVDTVVHGGDTDTNAAICGALLGAVVGIDAIPEQWKTAVLSCRPKKGTQGVLLPRPEIYWPAGALDLVDKLLETGKGDR